MTSRPKSSLEQRATRHCAGRARETRNSWLMKGLPVPQVLGM